ncbi:MAG: sensor histidine kinase [Dehalococcoidales bacterium]|nr:sensor histidine kinase [Dehalococcoidales bacterium]
MRRYSHELRPAVLDRLGLLAAIEQIAEDVNKQKQIKVELTVEGEEPELSDDIKLAFFRIAQEALNNARKHAQASKASVKIVFQEKQVRMEIGDNGTGFDIQEAQVRASSKGSLGLMSMQERSRLIGGNLRIESQPSKGTTVRVETPL